MSKKDFDKYYNEVTLNYRELLQDLKDMEEQFNNKLVSPEVMDNLKKIAEPTIMNYRMLSYVNFLLNMPTRKMKQDGYKKRQKELLKQLQDVSKEAMLEKDKEVKDKIDKLEI